MVSGPYRSQPALTDQAQRFALGLAAGLGVTEAARVAGYSAPAVVGSRLAQDDRVRAVVRARRNRRIDKLASLSLHELEAMIRDRKVSAAVRFNAIKLSLAMAGHVEAKAPEDDNSLNKKSISEMSVEELDAFIAAEKGKRAAAAAPILDHEPHQSTPNPLIDNEKTAP